MKLKVIHTANEQESIERGDAKLPLHKDPVYLANLKRSFVEAHNKKIRSKKASALTEAI